jgi:protein TonB
MRRSLVIAISLFPSIALADDPPPRTVPPAVLEGHRVSGEKNIVPDDITKTEIARAGKEKVVGSFKLCLDTTGAPSAVKQLKSTGFSKYDEKIISGIKTWRYRPYEVDGKPTPVCTAVTFIYSQPSPPPPPPKK